MNLGNFIYKKKTYFLVCCSMCLYHKYSHSYKSLVIVLQISGKKTRNRNNKIAKDQKPAISENNSLAISMICNNSYSLSIAPTF